MPQSRGKEILYFHYMTYMAMPQYKNPCPIMKFTIRVNPSLIIITTAYSQFVWSSLGVEKKVFQEIMHFHYMTYMATS